MSQIIGVKEALILPFLRMACSFRTLVVFVLLLLAFFAGNCNSATLISNFTAENGTVGSCAPSPLSAVTVNCIRIVSSPVQAGSKAYEMYLARDGSMLNSTDPTYWYRTEAQGVGILEFGKTYALKYDFMWIDWDTDLNSSETWPGQIHETPSDWSKWVGSCSPSAFSTSPYFMGVRNGVFTFSRLPGVTMWTEPVVKNVWHRIIIYIKLSKSTDGFIQTWYDGAQKPIFNGQTHRSEAQIPSDCAYTWRPPKLTMGTYKWDWKVGQPPRSITQHIQADL